MRKTIIIYSSVDGQTKKICQYINDSLSLQQHLVEMFDIKNLTKEISEFDKIIIASSIRYGKHNERIEKFIQHNYNMLNTKITAFISVNLVARKTEKSKPETNPYVIKFLKKIKWSPSVVEVFAGTLNYKLYGLYDKLLIKLIMLITKGPTNSKLIIEYTDWNKVKNFAEKFGKLAK